MCRKEIPDVVQVAMDIALHHLCVAKRHDTTEEERQEQCRLAIIQLEKSAGKSQFGPLSFSQKNKKTANQG